MPQRRPASATARTPPARRTMRRRPCRRNGSHPGSRADQTALPALSSAPACSSGAGPFLSARSRILSRGIPGGISARSPLGPVSRCRGHRVRRAGQRPAVRARPRVLAVPPDVRACAAAVGHHLTEMRADATQPTGDDGIPARADGYRRRRACPIGHGRLTSGRPPRHRKTPPDSDRTSQNPAGVTTAGSIVTASSPGVRRSSDRGRYHPKPWHCDSRPAAARQASLAPTASWIRRGGRAE